MLRVGGENSLKCLLVYKEITYVIHYAQMKLCVAKKETTPRSCVYTVFNLCRCFCFVIQLQKLAAVISLPKSFTKH